MLKIINRVISLSLILTAVVTVFWIDRYYNIAVTYNDITLLNIFTLAFYAFIIKFNAKFSANSKKWIYLISSVYILLFSIIYIDFFHYYNGDFFDFQRGDTIDYHNLFIRTRHYSLSEYVLFLKESYKWDDIGASLYGWILYKIYPHPLFFYSINIIVSFVTSYYLYKLSRLYINQKEAFIVCTLFILSSFYLYFHVSLYKETIFIFLSIFSIYLAQNLFLKFKLKVLLLFILTLFVLSLFRIGTPIIILLSYFIFYLLVTSRKFNIKNILILIILIPLFFYLLIPLFTQTYGHYNDREFLSYYVTESGYSYSLPVQIAISIFSSFFGPIPTFVATKGHEISSFYYAGYLVKYLLTPYFLLSVVHILKTRITYIYPVIIYYTIGSLIFGLALRGFDIRFLITHTFLYYLVVIFGISNFRFDSFRSKLFILITNAILIIILMVFNTRFT